MTFCILLFGNRHAVGQRGTLLVCTNGWVVHVRIAKLMVMVIEKRARGSYK